MNLNLLHILRITTIFCIFGYAGLSAQPPAITCPGAPVSIDDTSDNDYNFWNAAYWLDPVTNSHDLGESATALEITGTGYCNFSGNLQFRYIISLDLDYNNSFETFIDSDSLPANNTVYSGNSTGHLFSGTARQFDSRQAPNAFKWGFDIAIEPVGNNRKARVIWKNDLGQTADPQLPYGTHKIKWIVTDSCGGESVCEYGFTVKDTQKPTVVCLNGPISLNLMNIWGGLVQLWASDFLQYTEDNYTPSNQLKIAVRHSGTGTGFPVNPDGTPQTGVQFTCANLGPNTVELWSKDKDGNAEKCEMQVLIQDNLCVCASCGGGNIAGKITTAEAEGIADVSIELNANSNGIPLFNSSMETDTFGNYSMMSALPLGDNATVSPVMELDPLNGVNTWDLILVSRHILGLEPLLSPYKLISADANKSGTVTTFDVVELRKLILGTYLELPNNRSWRFIDQSQVFADPLNPFAEAFRESLPISSLLNGNLNGLDFIGCKIGDVDFTAVPHFQAAAEERNFDYAVIPVKDQQLHAGESFTLHFKTPENTEGLQMTLSAKGLILDNIIPGVTVSRDNFGLFEGGQTDRFAPVVTAAFENGVAEFDLRFTAMTEGLLSDMLQISNDITPSMAFEKNGQRRNVALRFEKGDDAGSQPVLFQNTPNPWSTTTVIPFYVPEAGEAQLSIINQQGSVVYSRANFFQSGYQEIALRREQLPNNGIYYVRLKTDTFTGVKKMVVGD